MGWERKRGKLLDFNRLIKGKYDSFPVKVGDLLAAAAGALRAHAGLATPNCRAARRTGWSERWRIL